MNGIDSTLVVKHNPLYSDIKIHDNYLYIKNELSNIDKFYIETEKIKFSFNNNEEIELSINIHNNIEKCKLVLFVKTYQNNIVQDEKFTLNIENGENHKTIKFNTKFSIDHFLVAFFINKCFKVHLNIYDINIISHNHKLEFKSINNVVRDNRNKIIQKMNQSSLTRQNDEYYKSYINIINDFLYDKNLSKSTILELGPGTFDFATIARSYGAEMVVIDKDLAVIELGIFDNFNVIASNLITCNYDLFKKSFDGIFCRASINPFWFTKLEELEKFIIKLDACVNKDGWALISPYIRHSHRKNYSTEDVNIILAYQKKCFINLGYNFIEEHDNILKTKYNINSDHSAIIFYKNINPKIN
tara:strand:+ start:16 stop:1089 length:1074 start_codon:yes stop_codon:yes gene_type:complete